VRELQPLRDDLPDFAIFSVATPPVGAAPAERKEAAT